MVPKRKLSNESLWITLLKSFSQKSVSWASSAVDKCDSKFGCRVIFEASLMWLLVIFFFTHKAMLLVFVSISASQSGQSEKVSFFWPIRSQIVQESRIFSRFTFGILLIKPGVVLLTTQVTNKTDANFPSLYAWCQTLICSSIDLSRSSPILSQKLSHLSHLSRVCQNVIINLLKLKLSSPQLSFTWLETECWNGAIWWKAGSVDWM